MPDQQQEQTWKPTVPPSHVDPENQVHIVQHSMDPSHFHTVRHFGMSKNMASSDSAEEPES